MAENHPIVVRVLWWVTYIYLTGVSWIMIYSLLYTWHELNLSTEANNSVVSKELFPFPAVTVCPTTKIVAGRFNVSEVNPEFLNISWNSQRSEILNNIKLLCDEYERIGKAKVINVEVMQILFQYLAPSVSEVIDSDETFIPILTNHGLCFSNNMLDGRYIFREDVIFYNNLTERGKLVKGWSNSTFDFYSLNSHGIKTEEKQPKYYPKNMSDEYNLKFRVKSVPQDNEFKCKSEAFQFKVFVHNPAELPLSTDATTFLADQLISISVKPELISTDESVLDRDTIEKKCISFGERNLSFFRTYTEKNCIMECLTNLTMKFCNCVTFYMPRLNITTKICSAKLLNCTKYAEDKLKTELTSCECKPSCKTLSYTTNIFTQYWPQFMDHGSNLTIKSSSEHFFVTYTRKNAYDINALISDVGGINGFFTGLSVSSIIEFVYFLVWKILRNLFQFVRQCVKCE